MPACEIHIFKFAELLSSCSPLRVSCGQPSYGNMVHYRQSHFSMHSLLLGRYRHFKGNEYEVIEIAKHSETREEFVVYRALYGDTRQWWIRPQSMFIEDVEHDGDTVPRFQFIS